MQGTLKIKRIYEKAEKQDGHRILVDRLWPRGISKSAAAIEAWEKETAPSSDLRKQFHSGTISFDDFEKAYMAELDKNPSAAEFARKILDDLRTDHVTFCYSAKNETENNAVVLKRWIDLHRWLQ